MAAVPPAPAEPGHIILGLAFYLWKAGTPDTVKHGLYLALMTAILALGAWMIWTSLASQRTAAAGPLMLALVILIYGALATYFAHLTRPEARPAALLMRDGSVIVGLWIGQDNNWLYLGEVRPGTAHSGRIISIRQDSVLASTLGVPSQLREALAREPELGHDLWCRVKGRCGS